MSSTNRVIIGCSGIGGGNRVLIGYSRFTRVHKYLDSGTVFVMLRLYNATVDLK